MTDTTLQDFRNRLAAIKAQQRLRKKEYDLVMAVCDKAETLAAELDAAKAENERLREFVKEFAEADFPATRNFTGPHPADEIEATTPADYIHAFQEDARQALKGQTHD